MNLDKNLHLKYHLWKNHGKSLLKRFEPEIRERYSYIFALDDFESLLKATDPILVERIELYQACMIESMIKIALDEIMEPLEYQTTMPARDHIEIHSQCQLGIIHAVRENPGGHGFQISRFYGSSKDKILEEKICRDLDEIINTIAGLEKIWRDKKSKSSS